MRVRPLIIPNMGFERGRQWVCGLLATKQPKHNFSPFKKRGNKTIFFLPSGKKLPLLSMSWKDLHDLTTTCPWIYRSDVLFLHLLLHSCLTLSKFLKPLSISFPSSVKWGWRYLSYKPVIIIKCSSAHETTKSFAHRICQFNICVISVIITVIFAF